MSHGYSSGSDVSDAEERGGVCAISKIIGINTPNTSFDDPGIMYYVRMSNKSYKDCEWRTEFFVISCSKLMMSSFKKKVADEGLISVDFVPNLFKPPSILFEKSYTIPRQIITVETAANTPPRYLIQWGTLPLSEATWETFVTQELLDNYSRNELIMIPAKNPESLKQKSYPFQPMMNNASFPGNKKLKDYQIEGVNWLLFKWRENTNNILADEMGLGKTIQSLAFLMHLKNCYHIPGPFLVVAPLSTITNWYREIQSWTDFQCLLYNGNDESRNILKTYCVFHKKDPKCVKFHIALISYEVLSKEINFFKTIYWKYLIIDEAHRLKNAMSKSYLQCSSLQVNSITLLTGTPVQNNIEEIWSLLHFIDAKKFPVLEEFSRQFNEMNEAAIQLLQETIQPYMLRRHKSDVETAIKEKIETIIEVELTQVQRTAYKLTIDEHRDELISYLQAKPINLNSVAMNLRKVCNHPYLFPVYEMIGKEQYRFKHNIASNIELKYEQEMEAMIETSGKTILIDKLLPKLREGNHKVLIFSQMTSLLDLLEDYLCFRRYPYERLDGSHSISKRSQSIDRFSKDEDSFVFLLSTRAGGVGINLTAADTVIIYDSDWNPQNDMQAMDRCHRIGQTKDVKVYRLICRDTYESEMYQRSSKKLGLDYALMNIGQSKSNIENTPSNKVLEEIIRKGSMSILKNQDDNQLEKFCSENIDQILENRTKNINAYQGLDGKSVFSKVSFESADGDSPSFWDGFFVVGNDNSSNALRLRNRKVLIYENQTEKIMKKKEFSAILSGISQTGLLSYIIQNITNDPNIKLKACSVLYSCYLSIGKNIRNKFDSYMKFIYTIVDKVKLKQTNELSPMCDEEFLYRIFGETGINYVVNSFELDRLFRIKQFITSKIIGRNIPFAQSVPRPKLWSSNHDMLLILNSKSYRTPSSDCFGTSFTVEKIIPILYKILLYEIESIIPSDFLSFDFPFWNSSFSYPIKATICKTNMIMIVKFVYFFGAPHICENSISKYIERIKNVCFYQEFDFHPYMPLLKALLRDFHAMFEKDIPIGDISWISNNIIDSINYSIQLTHKIRQFLMKDPNSIEKFKEIILSTSIVPNNIASELLVYFKLLHSIGFLSVGYPAFSPQKLSSLISNIPPKNSIAHWITNAQYIIRVLDIEHIKKVVFKSNETSSIIYVSFGAKEGPTPLGYEAIRILGPPGSKHLFRITVSSVYTIIFGQGIVIGSNPKEAYSKLIYALLKTTIPLPPVDMSPMDFMGLSNPVYLKLVKK